MATRTRRPLLLAASVILATAVGLGGCAGDSISAEDIEVQLRDGGMTDQQASCAADAIVTDLDSGQVEDVYTADTEQDAGDAWAPATEAIDTCVRDNPAG